MLVAQSPVVVSLVVAVHCRAVEGVGVDHVGGGALTVFVRAEDSFSEFSSRR